MQIIILIGSAGYLIVSALLLSALLRSAARTSADWRASTWAKACLEADQARDRLAASGGVPPADLIHS